MINYKIFTVGIEEEYMVIDPKTKELVSHEQKIVAEGQKIISEKVKAEMHQAVVEVGTDICSDIEEARHDIANLRKPYTTLPVLLVSVWVQQEHIPSAHGDNN